MYCMIGGVGTNLQCLWWAGECNSSVYCPNNDNSLQFYSRHISKHSVLHKVSFYFSSLVKLCG